MTIIPAVDIKNGQCVRLLQGRADTAVVYGENPLTAALKWQAQGAPYLHLVDLDGAFTGRPINNTIIKNILSHITIPAQVGGGIRTLDNIKEYLGAGANRVILGTGAATSASLLEKSVSLWGQQIAVSIDTSRGKIAVEGWLKTIDESVTYFVGRIIKMGVTTIIYTDTAVDGTLKGPNLPGVRSFVSIKKDTETNIIISGGIATIEDVNKLKQIPEISGIIIGKALYTGKISLTQIL